MRNNYVGDIGDFANNGLLRALCGTPDEPVPGLKLGVVWYLNNSPEDAAGNAIGYLNVSDHNKRLYRECDPDLYDELRTLVGRSLVTGCKRHINQTKLILPASTKHYDAPVPDGERKNWLRDALKETATADVIFFNPDRGMALKVQKVNSHKRIVGLEQTTKSLEHTSTGDLYGFAKREQSLVIYQHNPRVGKWITDIARKLQKQLSTRHHPRVWALRWKGIQSRAYFIVAQTEEHKSKLEERLEPFKCKKTCWVKKGLYSLEVDI